jgi:hypothetical protein
VDSNTDETRMLAIFVFQDIRSLKVQGCSGGGTPKNVRYRKNELLGENKLRGENWEC